MDAALDRRKRLKAMAEGATEADIEEKGALVCRFWRALVASVPLRHCCVAAGQTKLSNPLVVGPPQSSDAPSFSFYRCVHV